MKKFGKILGCLLPMVVGYVCQFAIAVIASAAYTAVVTTQAMLGGITDEAELLQFVGEQLMNVDYLMTVTAIATFVTLVIGVFWYKKQRPQTDFKLKELINGKLLLAMFLLGVSLQLLVSMCLNVVFPILPQNMTEEYGALMETLIGGNVLLSLLVTVILAPLAEELLFRGVTMKKAQKIMPFFAANVLQALLFGIYHGNLIQGTYAFVLGLVLGFTAEYFHSVWASILLHAFVNGSAELLNLLPESITATLVGVIALAAVGVGLLFAAAKLYPGARKEPLAAVEENKSKTAEFTENSFDE